MASSEDGSLGTTTYTTSMNTQSTLANRNVYKGQAASILLKLFAQRESWKKYGNLTVLCGGFFVLAPVKLWWWLCEIFVVLTVVVFAYEFFFFNWMIIVPAIIIAVLEWLAFYKTCLKDPGVQPRPTFEEAFKNSITVAKKWEMRLGTVMMKTHANGVSEQYHYCWRCHHFRSLTTNHCGTCDCCMIQHDHHCPVFGGCVANNNLRSFQTMVFTMGGFWLYIFGFCIYKMASSDVYLVDDEKQYLAAQFTMYLTLGEILAVVVLPAIVNFLRKLCHKAKCKKGNHSVTPSESQQIDAALKFVREKLSDEEAGRLIEILQTDTNTPVENTPTKSNDMNHNHFYSPVADTNNGLFEV